jgi:ribonucleotide reductase beta subunit family protein with ferritin-like domain
MASQSVPAPLSTSSSASASVSVSETTFETNTQIKRETDTDTNTNTNNNNNNNNMTESNIETIEPILQETKSRFVVFPIQYNTVWKMYKKAQSAYWTAEEIDLAKDKDDWLRLTNDETHFIKHILAFFAGSDGIVNENLAARFLNEIQIPEAKAFYAFQIAMETVHSETYSLLIDTYIQDPVEKDYLFNAISTIPCIQRKANWALKWISNDEASFASRLVAFACVEGIFFSGAFCAIYWLKERGVMPGLCFSNELISRDESLHTEFAVLLYSYLQSPLSQETVTNVIIEAVTIEKEFITESIPCRMLGMNADLMSTYIEFVADRLLIQLGYPSHFNARNPFDFMDRIGMSNKTNFFEARVSEYAKANVGGEGSGNGGAKDHHAFSLDEDF